MISEGVKPLLALDPKDRNYFLQNAGILLVSHQLYDRPGENKGGTCVNELLRYAMKQKFPWVRHLLLAHVVHTDKGEWLKDSIKNGTNWTAPKTGATAPDLPTGAAVSDLPTGAAAPDLPTGAAAPDLPTGASR